MLTAVEPGNAFLAKRRDPADDYLTRARMLVELAVNQRRSTGMLGAGQGTIDALLRPAVPGVLVADHDYLPGTPFAELIRELGLGSSTADLLAVLLASETDPAIAQLLAHLGATSAPTLDVLFDIVYRPRAIAHSQAAAMLHRDLAADALLRRLRLLHLDGVDSRPFLLQTIRIAPRLTSWLLGLRDLDPELAASVELVAPQPVNAPLSVEIVERVAAAIRQRDRVLVLRGARGSGRELVMRAAAHRLGRSLLVIDGRRLPPASLVVALREAVLQRALVFVRDADELFAMPETRQRFAETLGVAHDTIAITGSLATSRPIVEIEIPVPARDARLALWRAFLPEQTSMTKRELREVAGIYNLGVGGISAACKLAREAATISEAMLSRTHIASAVRRMFEGDLATVATRVEVSQEWSDLVLPDEVMASIRGVTDRIAYRNEVLGDWGFARKLGKGLGLTMLFSGPPGTGKSMVAGLIARELGLDLYVIDLSRIASKWIGETEKNLARAFDAAEAGHAMLLFDEADSVLGKRTTDVRSSNDRNANLETNFILARLEQFQGIAAFTTNIASAIDPAIARRMSATVVFPFPDHEARLELWQRLIPAEAPVAPNLDLTGLAQRFELSGGFIRNVVLRGAFLAAREGAPISTAHLERAARDEYGDRGALSTGGRLS
ncbi:MAG: ATP-binding protein [Deltaproteobacteria bacterium]|nr:ATP-binding protein [Deltaproteobacteria bacterium]